MATAPPPAITGNIRAEMARRGLTAAQVRRGIRRDGPLSVTHMSASTWETRMREPGTWKWSELAQLAVVLGVRPSELVRDA